MTHIYIYIHIYVCSAPSSNWYNSRVVLRKVGILTLLRKVSNLTWHKTIPELLQSKVESDRSGNKIVIVLHVRIRISRILFSLVRI